MSLFADQPIQVCLWMLRIAYTRRVESCLVGKSTASERSACCDAVSNLLKRLVETNTVRYVKGDFGTTREVTTPTLDRFKFESIITLLVHLREKARLVLSSTSSGAALASSFAWQRCLRSYAGGNKSGSDFTDALGACADVLSYSFKRRWHLLLIHRLLFSKPLSPHIQPAPPTTISTHPTRTSNHYLYTSNPHLQPLFPHIQPLNTIFTHFVSPMTMRIFRRLIKL